MLPRKFKRNLIAALVVPALAAPAAVLAQQQQAPQQPQQQQAQPQAQQQQQRAQLPVRLEQHDMRASQLIGMDVRSPQDENLGEVKDLVINTETGNVEYVALAHGGFLGLGQDLYAYPLDAFERKPDRNQLVLNVTREQLKQAQGFDANDWPKVREDRGFWARITDTFGGNRDRDRDRQRPAAGATERPATGATERERQAATGTTTPPASQQEAGRAPVGASQQAERAPQDRAQAQPRDAQRDGQKEQFVRASDIKGERVRDQRGGNLGQIEDLIVNMQQGEVRYAVVDTEGDNRLVAVSMKELTVKRDNGRHVVQFTKDKLDLSKSFSQEQWRDMQRTMDGDRRAAERRTDRPAAGATAEPAARPGGAAAPAPGERTTR